MTQTFSVLIPTYNHEKYISQALDSLISQTYPHWEALVINDGSTDGTKALIDDYENQHSRIKVIHLTCNRGVAAALNVGLANAAGDWVCWLSSDDLFESEKLATHIKAIQENPEIRVFHSNYQWLDETTQKVLPVQYGMPGFIPSPENQVIQFFRINYFNGITIAIHKSVFTGEYSFDPQYSNGQDFDLWLRISMNYTSFYLEDSLAITRLHPDQGTNQVGSLGIFDSAWSLTSLLNKYPFSRIFPKLDLSSQDGSARAISATCAVLRDENSYINMIGCGHGLLNRMLEWISQTPHEDWKRNTELLQQNLSGSKLSGQLLNTVTNFLQNYRSCYTYRSCDPFMAMKEKILDLKARGKEEQASELELYLRYRRKKLEITRKSDG